MTKDKFKKKLERMMRRVKAVALTLFECSDEEGGYADGYTEEKDRLIAKACLYKAFEKAAYQLRLSDDETKKVASLLLSQKKIIKGHFDKLN